MSEKPNRVLNWLREQNEIAQQQGEQRRAAMMTARAAKEEQKHQERVERETRRARERAAQQAREAARRASLHPIEDIVTQHNRQHNDDLTVISRRRIRSMERDAQFLREEVAGLRRQLATGGGHPLVRL